MATKKKSVIDKSDTVSLKSAMELKAKVDKYRVMLAEAESCAVFADSLNAVDLWTMSGGRGQRINISATYIPGLFNAIKETVDIYCGKIAEEASLASKELNEI